MGCEVGETLELVSWGSRGEFDHSELQVEHRLFEACGPFALDKAQFPGSKENKHIKIKKKGPPSFVDIKVHKIPLEDSI